MIASPPLVLLGLENKRLIFRLRKVEMSHVACRDHRLDLATQDFFEARDKVNFEFVGILEDLGIEEDLVGFAEAEVELVLVKQLLVRLGKRANVSCATALRRAGDPTYLCPLELHCDAWCLETASEDGWICSEVCGEGKRFGSRKMLAGMLDADARAQPQDGGLGCFGSSFRCLRLQKMRHRHLRRL